METLTQEFINEDVLVEIPFETYERKKKFLPAAMYLKSFKETHQEVKNVDINIFYNILQHLIEWETMEINEAIFKTKYATSDYKTYIQDTFVDYEG